MDILTSVNAQHRMLIRHSQTHKLHRLIDSSPDKTGDWWIAPNGSFDYAPLPIADFYRWEIVEEPPLVALGPDSTDLTGAADPGASSVDLKALSDMISVGLDMTEVLQMNLEDPSHAHDLTKGLVEQFQGIQALLGDKASTRMDKGEKDA